MDGRLWPNWMELCYREECDRCLGGTGKPNWEDVSPDPQRRSQFGIGLGVL